MEARRLRQIQAGLSARDRALAANPIPACRGGIDLNQVGMIFRRGDRASLVCLAPAGPTAPAGATFLLRLRVANMKSRTHRSEIFEPGSAH